MSTSGPPYLSPHPRLPRRRHDHSVRRPGRLPRYPVAYGVSVGTVVKQLRPLCNGAININGATLTFPPAMPEAQRKILTDPGFNRRTTR